MSASWRGERISAPKSHVTRRPTMKTVFPLNLFFYGIDLSFSDMDIDGDVVLGLAENGGSTLGAEIIPMSDTG